MAAATQMFHLFRPVAMVNYQAGCIGSPNNLGAIQKTLVVRTGLRNE
jgi:hypothetical protein